MKTADFVETLEHRRFAEFCESCRRYRYIGLCYGPPGIGKTLSARHVSNADTIERHNLWHDEPNYGLAAATVFFTPSVVNTPAQLASGIREAAQKLSILARGPLNKRFEIALDTIRLRNEDYRRAHYTQPGYRPPNFQSFDDPPLEPTYGQVLAQLEAEKKKIGDPTTLVLIDEADRLRESGLEQVRALFDESCFGVVLIGMPGLEKRMARYPQLYSRIGFVHQFRALSAAEMRRLLNRCWTPAGVKLSGCEWPEEAIAAAIRITGGNFRLLNRLLAQMERVLEINRLTGITPEVVEAARESLVIGQV